MNIDCHVSLINVNVHQFWTECNCSRMQLFFFALTQAFWLSHKKSRIKSMRRTESLRTAQKFQPRKMFSKSSKLSKRSVNATCGWHWGKTHKHHGV